MVLPFLARTTSPGLHAFPLGMFSQSGAKPAIRNMRLVCVLTLAVDRVWGSGQTDDINGEFQSYSRHDSRTHSGCSTHICSHGIHA